MADEANILVVDDEAQMRDAISEYLGRRGYTVYTAASGLEISGTIAKKSIDLVLLDLGLPGEDGIALTRQLRALGNIGIIIVTAFGEAEDQVLGLESGADDYVVKPFGLRELLARVRSVLRRFEMEKDRLAQGLETSGIRLDEKSYDGATREFHRIDGAVVQLSSGECDLLELFLDNPDRVLSRDELVEITTHRGWEPFDRSIDVRIARLRRKIEQDPGHPLLIRTVRGIGYMYRPLE
jgi:two-component system OmpR family response regulator